MWVYIFKKYFPIKDFNLSYLKRTFNHRLKSCKNESSFPWIQNFHDDKKSSPFLHKIIGFFIMKKILKNVNAPFNNQEFLEGTQLAIGAVSSSISTQDLSRLQGMLGAQLSQCFKNSFLSLSEKQQNIYLKLEKTSIISITGVKSIFGKADPSDKHILRVCGQEIVGSKTKLETVIEESDSPWNDSKNIGEDAAKLGVTFQIDVKFKTEERFSISSNNTDEASGCRELDEASGCRELDEASGCRELDEASGCRELDEASGCRELDEASGCRELDEASGCRELDEASGCRELRSCYHTWKFESYVDWVTWDSDESYPISWQISDMDRFLETNFPDRKAFDTII